MTYMTYVINEVFRTVQGEGYHAGRKAIFVRFAGCNLWDGNPDNRSKGKGACAKWCDTDFFKGVKTDLKQLEQTMYLAWDKPAGDYFCVLTGGEPALQIDQELIGRLEYSGWEIAVETNGTVKLPFSNVIWTTCSPKLLANGGKRKLRLDRVDELKVVMPGSTVAGKGWTDEQLGELEDWATKLGCKRFYVAPMDPTVPDYVDVTLLRRNYDRKNGHLRGLLNASWKFNKERCYDFVIANPKWRISAQTHKMLNLP